MSWATLALFVVGGYAAIKLLDRPQQPTRREVIKRLALENLDFIEKYDDSMRAKAVEVRNKIETLLGPTMEGRVKAQELSRLFSREAEDKVHMRLVASASGYDVEGVIRKFQQLSEVFHESSVMP